MIGRLLSFSYLFFLLALDAQFRGGMSEKLFSDLFFPDFSGKIITPPRLLN